MLIAGQAVKGIGLGTAQFAFRDRSAEDSVATVSAALDAGVTLIDTALAYTRDGAESYAERVIAQALRGIKGEHPLIATKGGHWRDGDSFPVDGRPSALRAHCEISLRTLGVDRIGLYQLHHVDPAVPLLDSVGALEGFRLEGKVAAIGLSNVTIAQLDEALTIAPISTVQNRLSYGHPGNLPTALACAQRRVAYLAYSPFGGPSGRPPEAALAIAKRRGVSVQRVLLAWLRAQSPNIVPLVGASRPASIADSAALLELDDEDLADMTRLETLHAGCRLRRAGDPHRHPASGWILPTRRVISLWNCPSSKANGWIVTKNNRFRANQGETETIVVIVVDVTATSASDAAARLGPAERRLLAGMPLQTITSGTAKPACANECFLRSRSFPLSTAPGR